MAAPSENESSCILNGTDSPDWSLQIEDIECPLCAYNLRGLIEPRCPECGYRFEWRTLLEQRHHRHPYLFEHHPERNLWSAWRTFCGAQRPRRFWGALHPAQRIDVRRLLIFKLIWILPTVGLYFGFAVEMNRRFGAVVVPPSGLGSMKTFGSAIYASVLSSGPFLEFFLVPLLTIGSLLIFQVSMRRAKLRTAHILRCVAYTHEMMLPSALLSVIIWNVLWQGIRLLMTNWNGGPLSAVWPWTAWLGIGHLPVMPTVDYVSRLALIGALCGFALSLIWCTYRLCIAYRVYLRFHAPVLTVLTAQAVTFLALLTLRAVLMFGMAGW